MVLPPQGFPVVLHTHQLSKPATLRKLICVYKGSTTEVLKAKPRCLTKQMSAEVELVVEHPICIETFQASKAMGRFMLRYGGHTIAAGIVSEIKPPKAK